MKISPFFNTAELEAANDKHAFLQGCIVALQSISDYCLSDGEPLDQYDINDFVCDLRIALTRHQATVQQTAKDSQHE